MTAAQSSLFLQDSLEAPDSVKLTILFFFYFFLFWPHLPFFFSPSMNSRIHPFKYRWIEIFFQQMTKKKDGPIFKFFFAGRNDSSNPIMFCHTAGDVRRNHSDAGNAPPPPPPQPPQSARRAYRRLSVVPAWSRRGESRKKGRRGCC